MSLPRLKISHQLALLISAAVVLAVLVVVGLSLLNLRTGFKEYLQVRDDEQLGRLVALLEQRAANDPQLLWLRNDPEPLRTLMDAFNGRLPRGQRGPGADKPPLPLSAREGWAPLAKRVYIRDAQGRQLVGRPHPPQAPHTVRPVLVNGQAVAFVDLAAEPEPVGLDARFLQHQTSRLWWATLGSLALALIAAWWMAGRWSRPLLALQRASRDIARGKRTPLLQPTGALEIAQLMEDTNHMAAELSRLEEARRRWIAQISHELRTPLSVLRGELEAIEDGARAPTPQVLAGLRDEVLQLNRLVDDLHTLSVADMGGLHCAPTEGDAHAWLWRVAHRFAAQAQHKGLQLQLPPQDALPITVYWDFGRIEQLLTNLLTNSLRYTDAPGTIAVDWQCDGRLFTLTVADTPPGVSPADLRDLFEPLFRGDRARQRGDHHASGLGLSIARSIVLAHGGTVTASASARGGLQLCVRLPVRAPAQPNRGAA